MKRLALVLYIFIGCTLMSFGQDHFTLVIDQPSESIVRYTFTSLKPISGATVAAFETEFDDKEGIAPVTFTSREVAVEASSAHSRDVILGLVRATGVLFEYEE